MVVYRLVPCKQTQNPLLRVYCQQKNYLLHKLRYPNQTHVVLDLPFCACCLTFFLLKLVPPTTRMPNGNVCTILLILFLLAESSSNFVCQALFLANCMITLLIPKEWLGETIKVQGYHILTISSIWSICK